MPLFCPYPVCGHHLESLYCYHFLQQPGHSPLRLLGSWGSEGSSQRGLEAGVGLVPLTQNSPHTAQGAASPCVLPVLTWRRREGWWAPRGSCSLLCPTASCR